LNNAITELIQFKSIEVLLSLEVKNSELFVTTPDDISSCDEKYVPRMVTVTEHFTKFDREVCFPKFLSIIFRRHI